MTQTGLMTSIVTVNQSYKSWAFFFFFANLCTVDLVHKNQLEMRKTPLHLNTKSYISSPESESVFKQNHTKIPNCPVLCQHHVDPTQTETLWTGKTF